MLFFCNFARLHPHSKITRHAPAKTFICCLKIGLPVIVESLCDILHRSIATGVFPDRWKIFRAAPIFKSGQTNDRSNCRLISVLPFVSKVFEELIYKQLYDYPDRKKHFLSIQSGFRSLHSVVTCLLKCASD